MFHKSSFPLLFQHIKEDDEVISTRFYCESCLTKRHLQLLKCGGCSIKRCILCKDYGGSDEPLCSKERYISLHDNYGDKRYECFQCHETFCASHILRVNDVLSQDEKEKIDLSQLQRRYCHACIISQ
jgi:hypothetical protein